MMKRSASELALEEFIRKTMSMSTLSDAAKALALPDIINIVDSNYSNSFDSRDHHHQEAMKEFSCLEGEAAKRHVLLSQNLTPKRTTLDSQSSICVGNVSWGSPVSAGNKPKRREIEVRGATSGSSPDHQSDYEEEVEEEEAEAEAEDVETDAGQSEQSLDPSHLKRLRRMLSNRESARRSRKRKQEHLTDLELLAEEMRGENDSLYKQLTNAHQQFRDADTNNRVLKSDVEALRARVKLAEDVLARGSLTYGLNQLLRTHLTSPQTIANATHNHNLRRVTNVSPTITIHGDDSFYAGLTVSRNSALALANVDISNAHLNNGIGGRSGDAVSCVSEIWH